MLAASAGHTVKLLTQRCTQRARPLTFCCKVQLPSDVTKHLLTYDLPVLLGLSLSRLVCSEFGGCECRSSVVLLQTHDAFPGAHW